MCNVQYVIYGDRVEAPICMPHFYIDLTYHLLNGDGNLVRTFLYPKVNESFGMWAAWWNLAVCQ